jgi:hypothetical protein
LTPRNPGIANERIGAIERWQMSLRYEIACKNITTERSEGIENIILLTSEAAYWVLLDSYDLLGLEFMNSPMGFSLDSQNKDELIEAKNECSENFEFRD